jgi:diguanylate cyclase (GGDEF)-like protein
MVPNPASEEEARRLASLRALHLLDTPAEARFDRVTRLAARLLGAPVAVLALVDEDRVFVKSALGTTLGQAPREGSFAAAAILGEDVLVVGDAAKDARFAKNPLVAGEPPVRFCAAVPLRAPDGSRVGALCVLDLKPRRLAEGDRQDLHDLAALAEHELPVERMHPTQSELVAGRDGEELAEMIDPATRAWGRAAILDFLQKELSRAKREQARIGIVMLEIDGLARLRKERGEGAAGAVLHEGARRILAGLRPYDAVGRFSDDGFLMILPGSDALNTMRASERLRGGVAGKPVAAEGGGPVSVTLSMGVAASESPGRADVEALIRAAGTALDQARKAGGNRIELSGIRL